MPARLPITIAEWDRNAREVVRVALAEYNGRATINCRVWYRDGNELKPTKSGLTLSLKHLPKLAAGFAGALEKSRELGLIDSESDGSR